MGLEEDDEWHQKRYWELHDVRRYNISINLTDRLLKRAQNFYDPAWFATPEPKIFYTQFGSYTRMRSYAGQMPDDIENPRNFIAVDRNGKSLIADNPELQELANRLTRLHQRHLTTPRPGPFPTPQRMDPLLRRFLDIDSGHDGRTALALLDAGENITLRAYTLNQTVDLNVSNFKVPDGTIRVGMSWNSQHCSTQNVLVSKVASGWLNGGDTLDSWRCKESAVPEPAEEAWLPADPSSGSYHPALMPQDGGFTRGSQRMWLQKLHSDLGQKWDKDELADRPRTGEGYGNAPQYFGGRPDVPYDQLGGVYLLELRGNGVISFIAGTVALASFALMFIFNSLQKVCSLERVLRRLREPLLLT